MQNTVRLTGYTPRIRARGAKSSGNASVSSCLKDASTTGLLYGLYGNTSKDTIVVIIRACIDESSTHQDAASPMYMYCAVSTALNWSRFDKKWKKVLERNKLHYFHAEEALGNRGEFRGWKREDRIAVCNALDAIVSKHIKLGFCVVLSHKDFEAYRSGGNELNSILHSKWGLCFRFCMAFIQQVVPELIDKKSPEVYVLYENGNPNCGSATEIHRLMQKQLPNCIIKSAAPVKKEDCYGTQAADLRAAARMHNALIGDDEYTDLTSDQVAKFAALTKFTEFRIPLNSDLLLELRDWTILSKPNFVKRYGQHITTKEAKERLASFKSS